MANCAEVWTEAQALGQAAAEKEDARLGPESIRGLDCGFAWVVVKPARGELATFLRDRKLAHKHHAGGLAIWYSACHGIGTQSVSVHCAACRAVADVLTKAFPTYKIWTESRLD